MGAGEKAVLPVRNGMCEAEDGHGEVNRNTSVVSRHGEIVNASGHRDQLNRQYGLLSICGLALTIDNAWIALGGSIVVSIGEPGKPYHNTSA